MHLEVRRDFDERHGGRQAGGRLERVGEGNEGNLSGELVPCPEIYRVHPVVEDQSNQERI